MSLIFKNKKAMTLVGSFVTLAIVLIALLLAVSAAFPKSFGWFSQNDEVGAEGMSVVADHDLFELAVANTDFYPNGSYGDILTYLGTNGFSKQLTSSVSQTNIYCNLVIDGDTSGKVGDENYTPPDELSPGTFGHIEFYVIPKKDSVNLRFTMNLRGVRETTELTEVTEEGAARYDVYGVSATVHANGAYVEVESNEEYTETVTTTVENVTTTKYYRFYNAATDAGKTRYDLTFEAVEAQFGGYVRDDLSPTKSAKLNGTGDDLNFRPFRALTDSGAPKRYNITTVEDVSTATEAPDGTYVECHQTDSTITATLDGDDKNFRSYVSTTDSSVLELLKGHFLFFWDRDETTGYYSNRIVDGTFDYDTSAPERQVDKVQIGDVDAYKVTIYWVWPSIFGQLVGQNGDFPVLINGTLNDAIAANPEYYFYSSLQSKNYGTLFLNVSDNFEELSAGYNNGDQRIGESLRYLIPVFEANPIEL